MGLTSWRDQRRRKSGLLTDSSPTDSRHLLPFRVETHLGHVFAKLDVPAGSSQSRRVHAVRRYLNAQEEPPADRQPQGVPAE